MMLFNSLLDENSWKAEAEIDMELFHQVRLYLLFSDGDGDDDDDYRSVGVWTWGGSLFPHIQHHQKASRRFSGGFPKEAVGYSGEEVDCASTIAFIPACLCVCSEALHKIFVCSF